MKASLMELSFQISSPLIFPEHRAYRPPHWPPPREWCVSEGAGGEVVSVWSGPRWDFTFWAGRTLVLDFAGGKHNRSVMQLGVENQEATRLLATWLVWGPRSPMSWNTLKRHFCIVRRVAVVCETEGIAYRDLERYPLVIKKIALLFNDDRTRKSVLLVFDRLLLARDAIGFAPFGKSGLSILAQAWTDNPLEKEVEQTAYIPPRIWAHQNNQLRACLEDFLEHESEIEACYHFCVDAYVSNYGTLENAMSSRKNEKNKAPFSDGTGYAAGQYLGPFINTARNFNIADLLCKWGSLGKSGNVDIRKFGSYLSMVQLAAIIYIANFTFQRKEEAGGLRADCLLWETDEIVGKIAIICGETTKTDPDSDARWPTSPRVEIAVRAAQIVARMRMRCALAVPAMHCTADDVSNPFLFHYAVDPWSPSPTSFKAYSSRPTLPTYRSVLARFPALMNADVLRITEADLVKARMFTPNLDKDGEFAVGKLWPIAYHQLRRTGGVNMFASGLMSDSSVQVVMKHLTLLQSAYYGRNFTRLRFSEDMQGTIALAKYEVMAKQIETLVSERYVSPVGAARKDEIVVNLIGEKDFKALIKASERGEVSFRETRLGGCTKRGHCDYGGIESVARCTGGDGDKPCREAIFDKAKRSAIQDAAKRVQSRLLKVNTGSPRETALNNELQGMRNFLDVTKN